MPERRELIDAAAAPIDAGAAVAAKSDDDLLVIDRSVAD